MSLIRLILSFLVSCCSISFNSFNSRDSIDSSFSSCEQVVNDKDYNVLDFTNSAGQELYFLSFPDLINTNVLSGVLNYFKVIDSTFDKYDTSIDLTYSAGSSTFAVDAYGNFRDKFADNTFYSTPFNNLYLSTHYGDLVTFHIFYASRYQQWEVDITIVTDYVTLFYGFGYNYGTADFPTMISSSFDSKPYAIILQDSNSPLYYITHFVPEELSYSTGYNDGFAAGESSGYQTGYVDGLQTLDDTNTTAATIFNGIFEVGLLPVNVFLTIFNFNVFGINIAGIVSALLTVSIVIIIVRTLLGGKNGD